MLDFGTQDLLFLCILSQPSCHHSGRWVLISLLDVCLSGFSLKTNWTIKQRRGKHFLCLSIFGLQSAQIMSLPSLPVVCLASVHRSRPPRTPPARPSITTAATKNAGWFIEVNTRHVGALITAKPLTSWRNSRLLLRFFFFPPRLETATGAETLISWYTLSKKESKTKHNKKKSHHNKSDLIYYLSVSGLQLFQNLVQAKRRGVGGLCASVDE